MEQLLTNDSFLSRVIFTDDASQFEMAASFLSEFLAILKSLNFDSKAEVSKMLRNQNLGQLLLLFLSARLDDKTIGKQVQKNIALGYLELLYFVFRKDLDYTRNTFAISNMADLFEKIMRFEDYSTPQYPS